MKGKLSNTARRAGINAVKAALNGKSFEMDGLLYDVVPLSEVDPDRSDADRRPAPPSLNGTEADDDAASEGGTSQ